jgi:hypothetical protein
MTKGKEVMVKTEARLTFEEAARAMVQSSGDADAILLDILNADSVESILGNDTIGLTEMIAEPFTILSAVLRESDYEQGLPAFLVMQAERDNGDRIVITTGASTVVAQVVRMNQLAAFPVRVSSKKAEKPTAAGYYPLSLVKPPTKIEPF